MKEEIYRSQFRLPYELYEKLKEAADKSGSSVNAELVLRLQQSFDNPDEQLKKIQNKLAVQELKAMLSEASLTVGMMNLLTKVDTQTPETAEAAEELFNSLRNRLANLGDLEQRVEEITSSIITE
ncbi:Arc family DNA-binding protein [Halopseudomonas oceani]|uniref:Arc family DNA-binding protein n=1 Tax=Halopseudomonas oceani TaxID=1708783 RepID=UPI002AA925BD|nr:Arc family DNA-binding protein [Halopseudomonas oceani]